VAHKHLGHCHQLWQPDVYERLAGPDPLPPELDEVIYQPSIREISSLPDNYGIGVGVFVTDAFAFVLQRMIKEAMAQHRARELDRVWEQSATAGGKRPRL
ncbi:hypothetical protein, partial [Stenotrophomonas maltophilia]|uniref:hypothetical protein n=1 Tax=Stenotrophomonas maltophilia TaxID=40324 RepID=UPI001C8DB333